MDFLHNAAICIWICFAFIQAQASEWGYTGENGPSHWSDKAPKCAGESQSPIDIVSSNVLIDPTLRMLEFDGYDKTLGGGEFLNNGHSVQLTLNPNETYRMSGGGMGNNTYRALQLHFHWAATGSQKGSEHTVDGQQYPVEMHVVHIKEPYTKTEEIKDMPDGLAVLGVFLQIGNESNNAYKKLFKAIKKCTFNDSTSPLRTGPSLFSLLPDSGSYYRYSGSLTTPKCHQTVTWTVLKDPVYISESQLGILQSLKSVTAEEADEARANGTSPPEEGGNYRPTQPLNGRIVTSYLDIRFSILEKSHGWTYYDPHNGVPQWPKNYPTCGKTSQSPINVESSAALKPSSAGSGLTFKGYENKLKGRFLNNGHAVQLNFDKPLDYTIESGGLEASYTALQLHFHWGEAKADGTVDGGSEHTLDGVRYPAEMHIVHAKTSKVSNISAYSNSNSDAYAVLGIFIEVHKSDSSNDEGANDNMQKLFDTIETIKYFEEEVNFPAGPSLSSLLPASKSFYRYNGSLTTPPCTESVIWTVFQEPIEISLNQFIAFQQLFNVNKNKVSQRDSIKIRKNFSFDGSVVGGNKTRDTVRSVLANEAAEHLLRNNYRPVQSVNDRAVYYYNDGNNNTVTPSIGPPESPGMPVLQIVLFTAGGVIIFVVMLVIVMRCCCKKDEKKSSYTAGHKEGEAPVNL